MCVECSFRVYFIDIDDYPRVYSYDIPFSTDVSYVTYY
jgi:hypothetical protein